MDIRIRNQKELDKIFETVDSIYGFFVSALPHNITKTRANTQRLRFSVVNGVIDLCIFHTYASVHADRYNIRDIKHYQTRIERYL